MKKLFSLIIFALLPLMASAYDAQINGIYYNFNSNTKEAIVTHKESETTYVYNDNKDAYTGDVTIPETVTYNGVTYNVTTIGERAFICCSNMTSVVIPNSIKTIEEWAFYMCASLTELTIPNSVTSIGRLSFCWCSGLTSVVIPANLTSVGEEAFSACDNMKSITVDKGNKVYDSRDNCNAIIETETNTLISGCSHTIIPNSVTSIGNYVFVYQPDITSVTIPSSVTSIGIGVFNSCSNLTDIFYYAENVPTINSQAFNFAPVSSITLHVPAASVEAYKATVPWNSFGNIVALDDKPEVKKCATPYIAFYDGKLIFGCETLDVTYVCKLSNIEFETDGTDVSLILPSKITLAVYATKEGYEPSDPLIQEIDPRLLLDKRGDVNLDGEISMQDIMYIVQFLLNGKYPDQ